MRPRLVLSIVAAGAAAVAVGVAIALRRGGAARAPEAPALAGRVVEIDGSPIEGARVALASGAPPPSRAEWAPILEAELFEARPTLARVPPDSTDARGRFRLPGPDPNEPAAYLVVDAGLDRVFVRPLGGDFRPDEEVDVGDVVAPATIAIAGIVVDERREPVGGARVRAVLDDPDSRVARRSFRFGERVQVFGGRVPEQSLREPQERRAAEATTAADGAFRLERAAAGARIQVTAPGWWPQSFDLPGGRSASGVDAVEIELEPGRTISIALVDERGEPAAGGEAWLGLCREVFSHPFRVSLQERFVADADGRVAVRGVPPGAIVVAARAAGAPRGSTHPTVETGDAPIVVRVATPGSVLASCRDESGGLVRASFELAGTDGRLTALPAAPAEEGRVRIGGLPPGVVVLLARAPGHEAQSRTLEVAAGRELETTFAMRRVQAARLRVVDGGGSPVEGAAVTVVEPRPLPAWQPQARFDGVTDARGVLELPPGPGDRFRVLVRHPAFATDPRDAELAAGALLEIALERGGAVEGVVSGALPRTERPWLIRLDGDDDSTARLRPRYTAADAAGGFRFARVPAGRYRIAAAPAPLSGAEAFDPAVVGSVTVETSRAARVELHGVAQAPFAALRGRVLLGGGPFEGARVRLGGDGGRAATTDSEGRFDLGSVSAGIWRVVVESGGGPEAPSARWIETPLDLAPGSEATELRVERGAPIRGVVKDVDRGRPVRGARVTAVGASRGIGPVELVAISDAEGRFETLPTPPGVYALLAEADSYHPAKGAAAVDAGDELSEPIVLWRIGASPCPAPRRGWARPAARS